MKINKQDEYGLRILLRIAHADPQVGLNIPQLSELEGMSRPYVGKITRVLRLAGLIQSTRGQKGGYVLAKKPDEIKIKEIINSLGGNLFSDEFCNNHAAQMKLCTNSVDCSVRSLWKILQFTVDRLFEKITLQDLMGSENQAKKVLESHIESIFPPQIVQTIT